MEEFSIGETAKMTGISIQTLRYYDSIDLLKPKAIHAENHYRFYSQENMTTLMVIKQLRKLNFSIEKIRVFIQSDSIEELEQVVTERIVELREEEQNLKMKSKVARDLLKLIKEGSGFLRETEITEKTYQMRNVISIRRTCVCNSQCYVELYGELLQIAEQYNLHITGELYTTYYSRMYELDHNHADMEVSATVLEAKSDCPQFHIEPAFDGISKFYKGPYEQVVSGYSGMLEYIAEHRYPIPEYFLLRYIISKAHVMKSTDFITEIILPKKKS